MDRQDKKKATDFLIYFIVPLALVFVTDFLWRIGALHEGIKMFYRPFFEAVKNNPYTFKLIYLALIGLLAYNDPKTVDKPISRVLMSVVASVSLVIFLLGYNQYLYYNIIIYPLSFIVGSLALHNLIQTKPREGARGKVLTEVPGVVGQHPKLEFKTDKGTIQVPNPDHGIWIESTAGGGKTTLIENIIYQAVKNNYCGFVYDYEGNPLETDQTNGREGTILTRAVYTSLKQNKKSNVKFAFLNFNDLTRTVRTNVYNPRYFQGGTHLDVIEMSNTLMKNLEPEWVKKTDFWAANAINSISGVHLYLMKHQPQFCTVPHLVSIMLSDFRAILNMLSSDKELEAITQPVLSAYRQKAHQQTAGVISSSQLPLIKLYVPEIFWVLSPPPEEDFDLNITGKDQPVFFCIGNNPTQTTSLGPVIALIGTICQKQMNQFNKHKAVYIMDEIDSIYMPNLDVLPARARKKGVITILSAQLYSQVVRQHGEETARIIRGNLSNQFIGKTNDENTAERIVKLFGEYERQEFSFSTGDSGESQTQSTKPKKYLQMSDVTLQNTGHFTGYISNAQPPMYHAQFKNFELDKLTLPRFSKRVDTGDLKQDDVIMKEMVQQNFDRIRADAVRILQPFMPVDQ